MNTDDDARCEEIERNLKDAEETGFDYIIRRTCVADERFLLDLARTADAMLRTAFLDHGLDVEALVAEAEKRAALKCRYICWQATRSLVGVPVYAANRIADAIAAAFNLPSLEEPGR